MRTGGRDMPGNEPYSPVIDGMPALNDAGPGFLQRVLSIWEHRRVLFTLVKKDVKARYKESLLGYFWTLLNPIFNMLVFVVVFSFVFRVKVPNYPLYIITGIIPWGFFQVSVSTSAVALRSNGGLIKQIYTPKEMFVFLPILSNFVHLLFSFVAIIPFMIYYTTAPTWRLSFLPAIIICHTLFILGIGLVFSILTLYFTDAGYFLEHIMRVWFYATPLLYPVSFVPESLQKFYMLNPTATFALLYRWALTNSSPPDIQYILLTLFLSLVSTGIGFWFFGRYEKAAVKLL